MGARDLPLSPPLGTNCYACNTNYVLSTAATVCSNGTLLPRSVILPALSPLWPSPLAPLWVPVLVVNSSGSTCSLTCGSGYGLNAPYTLCTNGAFTIQQVCVPLLTSNTYVTYSFSAISCSPWGLVVDSGNNLVITCQNANVYRFSNTGSLLNSYATGFSQANGLAMDPLTGYFRGQWGGVGHV